MLNSIGNTALVRCREVVRFSEGPLSEARLYSLALKSTQEACDVELLTTHYCRVISSRVYSVAKAAIYY